MTVEKRKHVRFDAVNPSEVTVYQSENYDTPVREGQGKTVNISKGGALLETTFPIGNNQALSLIVNIGAESVYISGRVAHSRREETNRYKTGIEFTVIEDKGRQILNKYIDLFIKKQGPASL